MQPSLVFAGLALSTFLKSSEINRGRNGRIRALWIRDMAQASLDASFNARWIDPTLAQAAWVRIICYMLGCLFSLMSRSTIAFSSL